MVGSSAHWYQAATTTGLNPCKNVGFESLIVAAVNHFATMYRRHRDGTESGYLTGDGLTLAANSAVKIPVVSGMPDGIEIYMDFTLPASLYGDGLSNKGFILLAKGTANVLAFGSEQYCVAFDLWHCGRKNGRSRMRMALGDRRRWHFPGKHLYVVG